VEHETRRNVVSSITLAYNGLINALRCLAGVVIFGIFVLIVADVFVRLIGIRPWLYSNILVEYGLLWFAMLAAPHLVRTKGHVFIDAITQLLPQDVRRVTAKIAYLICVVSSLTFSYYSLQLLIGAIADNEIDVRAVDMPLWTLLLPIPFCFVLVAIEFIRYLIGWDSMYGERTEVKESV
jgi:C4-dicarboxylate transporter, DctQ subunit